MARKRLLSEKNGKVPCRDKKRLSKALRTLGMSVRMIAGILGQGESTISDWTKGPKYELWRGKFGYVTNGPWEGTFGRIVDNTSKVFPYPYICLQLADGGKFWVVKKWVEAIN